MNLLKTFVVLLFLLFSTAHAADSKISDLPPLLNSEAASSDLFVVVDLSANITKRMSFEELDKRWFIVSSDIDHDQTINTHNLTTDIDHNTITNNHNLTTDIDHNTITNHHNLTTDINHNALLNYDIAQHRIINDSATTSTSLWSSTKIADAIENSNPVTPIAEMYENSAGSTITLSVSGTYYKWATSGIFSSDHLVGGWTHSTSTDTLDCGTGCAGEYSVSASLSSVGTANQTVECAIFKEGVIQDNLVFAQSFIVGYTYIRISSSISGLLTIAEGDSVDLRCKSLTSGNIITVLKANVSLVRVSK